MSDKTGKPYENLTEAIFKLILGQKDLPNLVVERDVTLQGKIRPHQIDVYWKFETGGITHEVVVQAKDWQKPVDQLHLLAFSKILEDLPGQPKGIFVTRSGYQQGAEEFGLACGILLYELKEIDYPSSPVVLTIDGWARIGVIPIPVDGFISTEDNPIDANKAVVLGFVWEIFTPYFSPIKYDVPRDWMEAEYPIEDIDSLTEIKLPLVPPDKSLFFDDKGSVVSNLQIVRREISLGMRDEGVEQKQVAYVFEPAVFIETGSSRMSRVKVTGFSTNVEIKRTEVLRRVKMPNFAQLVLHQLNSNKNWWFATTPEVISKLSKRKKDKKES
jgi:Restriction endonuclease